ncbi:SRPBCC family protein [Streptomyces scopuliridis]|uniref:SRPBCC family protein n=1 Tax=Streptomyces scopuliridis TaxID=452529 RepID=A0ACD4ZJ05_9ACTN|nr:SRPBCC family protein [Streptomyces scopuliridis]WSB33893.1 SRPBCC family protein [Streptomyces scopuliridis]WSB98173.1 SRPBCC family protein [Streptomyces scopuliridis]WSC08125.1 SRPBCC family protein [Streptomyces scopuliridis]
MAVRHQLIAREPAAVWRVLSDPARYADWVVGTARSFPGAGRWPEVGSSLTYTVRLGSKELRGHTVVRRHEPPQWLEVEAHSGRLGTARIAFDIRSWGDETLVIVDEHPLRGFAGTAHNLVMDAFLQIRHRGMLARLANVVEHDSPASPGSSEAATSAPPGESTATGGGTER